MSSRKNQLTPDFSHRLAATQTATSDINDSICLMTDRALVMLHLLYFQFEKGNNFRLSDELMCGAIDAVIQEVTDISATVGAFSKAQKSLEL